MVGMSFEEHSFKAEQHVGPSAVQRIAAPVGHAAPGTTLTQLAKIIFGARNRVVQKIDKKEAAINIIFFT